MFVMKGITYVTDEKGKRVAIQISLLEHKDIVEDLLDGIIAESRKKNKTHSLAAVKKQLLKDAKL